MLTKSLSPLFERELNAVKKELSLYQKEENIWKVAGQVNNSAGNLALHICGNLQHFFGAVLSKTNYVRNREEEFSRKNIPIDELFDELDKTIDVVKETLSSLHESDLQKLFPARVTVGEVTTEFFILHLALHLSYHLGQVTYHRRLLDN